MAVRAAQSAIGHPVNRGEAVAWCIRAQSDSAMQAVATTINAQIKAATVAHTFIAVKRLSGDDVELMESQGYWWLASPGSSDGYYMLGEANKTLLLAELAKVGGSLH